MISNSPTLEELSIAPGVGQQERSISNDNFLRGTSFSVFISKRKV